MQDPFPYEFKTVNGSLDEGKILVNEYKKEDVIHQDLDPFSPVYHPDQYVYNMSPRCIFFPRKEILFKMMRATLGVRNTDELWFRRGRGYSAML